jgi:hypothetical protein
MYSQVANSSNSRRSYSQEISRCEIHSTSLAKSQKEKEMKKMTKPREKTRRSNSTVNTLVPEFS